MRGWRLIAAGTVLFWGWVVIASAIWPGDHTPVIGFLPLLAGALITVAAAGAGLRDRGRRFERLPLWLAVTMGGLELVGVVWGMADEQSQAYALPLGLAMALVPVVPATAFGVRRFRRAPERVRPPVGVRLRRGWNEATKSWSLLAHNSGLLVLPLTSFVIGTGGWIGAYLLAGSWVERTMPRLALTSFIVLLPATLLGTFLGAAFIGALNRRLDGQRATAADGLRIAWRHRGPLFRWALLAAGVGAILQGLQQIKSEWALAPLVAALAGIAWGVLTLFALPILAIEGVGVRDAARRAGALVRDNWGEGMGGLGNITTVSAAVTVPFAVAFGIAVGVAAVDHVATTALYATAFVVFMFVIYVMSSATQVLSVALYRHATGGSTGPFTSAELNDALVRRRKLR